MILLLAVITWLVVFLLAWARRRTSNAWTDVLAIGGIGLATAGFFWRLLAGQVWMPAGGGDLAHFLYPTYSFAAEWWRRGVIPLWNPYLFGGAPFVGDIQSGIFYPLNLLTFFISSPLTFRDMEFLSVLHFFIAGAGMYLFLRCGKWGQTKSESKILYPGFDGTSRITNYELRIPAALAGAIAFEFSDLFITHFGNLNLIAVIAWMPMVLLFYRRAIKDGRPGLAVVSGVLLGVAFLAGHIQMFLFILVALVLLAMGMMIEHRIRRGDLQHYIGGLAIIAVVSFCIAAPSLLPSIEMTQNSVRADFSYEQAAQFSLPPAQLIGLFVPGFFGRGASDAWGPWQRVEVGYIGVLPMVLALLALLLRRDSPTRFFGALALIGLALALGGYAIAQGWQYLFVPVFGQLRAPARFIVVMDFALAVLSAFGFDVLLRALPRASEKMFKPIVRAAPWVFLLIAAPAGALAYSNLILGQGQDAVLFQRIANATNALAFFILLFALSLGLIVARGTRYFRPTPWAIAALALIFFDLFSLGAYVDTSTGDPTQVYSHPDAVTFFKSDGSFYRVDPRETGVDSTWSPDTSILYQLFDINGDNPLVLADWDRYWQALGSRSTPLYDLLNIKYLIASKSAPIDRDKFRLAFDGDPGFNIYENTRVLPRAFIVNDAQPAPSHAAALDAIHAPSFDPSKSVVVETADRRLPTAANMTPVNRQPPTVNIVGYGPNEILMDTNSANAGVLVLSEIYYPGWRAWVDGHETPVMRADYLFRAVELPAGTHRVRFAYDPAWFKIGAGLFIVIALGSIGGLVGWRMQK